MYVGQSIDILKRKSQYEKGYNVNGQKVLYRSLLKYGWDNHFFEIIEECEIAQLNNRERYWQDYYDCLNKGLNCKLTTSSNKSGKWSKEVKDKIRSSMLSFFAINGCVRKKGTGSGNKMNTLYQYTLNGEFLQEWKGLRVTAKLVNIQRTQLCRSIAAPFGKYRAGQYYWTYIKQ